MIPDLKDNATNYKSIYAIGIVTSALTILLSYAHFVVGKGIVQSVSIIDIALNLVTLFIFRKYLLQYKNAPIIASMDWYLCIYAVIFLSPVVRLILHSSASAEFKEALEVMDFFDGLVYITFLVIGIQLGVRVRRLAPDHTFLKMFGNTLIGVVPSLFIIKLFINNTPLVSNLPLHIVLSTIAQAPSLLMLLIFYTARQVTAPAFQA
jgi:hypothetical protein